MTERGPSERYEAAGMAPVRSRKSAALSFLLACVLAGAVTSAAWSLSPTIPLYFVASGAFLSFIGLLAFFGWMAGKKPTALERTREIKWFPFRISAPAIFAHA